MAAFPTVKLVFPGPDFWTREGHQVNCREQDNALVDLMGHVTRIGPNECRYFKQSEQTSVFARQRYWPEILALTQLRVLKRVLKSLAG